MRWTKYRLTTTTQAEALVGDMLAEIGFTGIEIENRIPLSEKDKASMFIDILPSLPPDDGISYVTFYAEEGTEEPAAVIKHVHAGLEELACFVPVGNGRIEVGITEDQDWINNWKQYFKPFRVDDSIFIIPTWETDKQIEEELRTDDLVIRIDPGTAFGTGAHETTKLCMKAMRKYLHPGESMLDIGCGSGILSIIGRKLGAGTVACCDIDPIAVEVAKENATVNAVTYDKLACGDVITDEAFRAYMRQEGYKEYDLIVANILADIIIPLSKIVSYYMKPGSRFISSGIIDTKASEVEAALLANGFVIVERLTMKEWVSFITELR